VRFEHRFKLPEKPKIVASIVLLAATLLLTEVISRYEFRPGIINTVLGLLSIIVGIAAIVSWVKLSLKLAARNLDSRLGLCMAIGLWTVFMLAVSIEWTAGFARLLNPDLAEHSLDLAVTICVLFFSVLHLVFSLIIAQTANAKAAKAAFVVLDALLTAILVIFFLVTRFINVQREVRLIVYSLLSEFITVGIVCTAVCEVRTYVAVKHAGKIREYEENAE
jgi:hypothetical protein